MTLTSTPEAAAPTPPVPAPAWLAPASVKGYLRLVDAADDDLVTSCCAAVEPIIEAARPDYWAAAVVLPDPPPPPVYVPGPDAYQGAVMLAARLYRRRNTPTGVESFADSVAYVARWDADIDRLIRTGGFRPPAVG